MFGVGPTYLFMLRQRLPFGQAREGWVPWVSTMATNGAIALVVAGMMWWVGVGPFLLVHLPITVLGGAIGVWLFYVQHQFEHTVWSENGNWSFPNAALHGSSHYDLPAVLRWFTANIGVHHVHHLCSRIPFYRLPLALRQHPDLANVGRLTLVQSLACVRLVLWDETAHRLISFRELRSCAFAPARLLPCKGHAFPVRTDNRHLAGQSGRFAFAECQAHVQTLQTSTNRVLRRAIARLWLKCTWISERISP